MSSDQFNRYAIFHSYACPWVYRVLIGLHLVDLMDVIEVYVLPAELGDEGWELTGREESVPKDSKWLHQLYSHTD